MKRIKIIVAASLLIGFGTVASGQTFNSGSNGSDGALNLTTPGTIVFDPKSFNPPLDPDGDGIFHFTTINIVSGVSVVLSGRNLNGPAYWLASGAVQIDGGLNLNGEPGHPGGGAPTSLPANRYPAYPGAGGFFGGMGGRFGGTTDTPAQPGGGPGGGVVGSSTGNGGSGGAGTYTGNQFAVPLIGGSGGGGGMYQSNQSVTGGGGGAGGGAILIASSASIRVNGRIDAVGSSGGSCSACGSGGPGGPGAIRLVANSITGTGVLNAGAGPYGPVRIEAFQYSGPTSIPGAVYIASPSNLFLPSGPSPSVRISSIAGVPSPSMPTGSFTVPDIAINIASAVPVVIEARNIPVGTVVRLRLFSEVGPDQILDTTPLAGTLALSIASASAIFPSGYSRGFVRATWTQ